MATPDSSVRNNNRIPRSHHYNESGKKAEVQQSMRVALIISGQTRFAIECLKRQIEYMKPDVRLFLFIHCWQEQKEENRNASDEYAPWINAEALELNTLEDIVDSFEIVRYSTNAPQESELLSYKGSAYRVAKMFWGIREANRLRCDYELEECFEFDIVVRTRYDFFVVSRSFSEQLAVQLDSDAIYYPEIIRNKLVPCDWWFYGSGTTMTRVCKLYDSLDMYLSEGVPPSGEELLFEHCMRNQIRLISYRSSGYLKRSANPTVDEIRRFGKVLKRDSPILALRVGIESTKVRMLALSRSIYKRIKILK